MQLNRAFGGPTLNQGCLNRVHHRAQVVRSCTSASKNRNDASCGVSSVPNVAASGAHLHKNVEFRSLEVCRSFNDVSKRASESFDSVRKFGGALAASILLLTCAPDYVRAEPGVFEGTARVVDGDTIYIGKDKFRLFGVDTPEKAQFCKSAKGQDYACGLVARDALVQKIGNQPVRCTSKQRDPYGREVGVCSLVGAQAGSDASLNRWLVENGHAVAYREFSKDYVSAEDAARAAHKGIWDGTFVYPATWRKDQRTQGSAEGSPAPTGGLEMPIMYAPPPTPPVPSATPSSKSAPPIKCIGGVAPIKGNISSKGEKIYHKPGNPYYDKVVIELDKGEAYFCNETDAVAKGFRPAVVNK